MELFRDDDDQIIHEFEISDWKTRFEIFKKFRNPRDTDHINKTTISKFPKFQNPHEITSKS